MISKGRRLSIHSPSAINSPKKKFFTRGTLESPGQNDLVEEFQNPQATKNVLANINKIQRISADLDTMIDGIDTSLALILKKNEGDFMQAYNVWLIHPFYSLLIDANGKSTAGVGVL